MLNGVPLMDTHDKFQSISLYFNVKYTVAREHLTIHALFKGEVHPDITLVLIEAET